MTDTQKLTDAVEGDSCPPTCSLLPVNFDGRVIMVDVSPMTVDQFKAAAIKMLEAHIARGEIVFPFIKANAKEMAPPLTGSVETGKKS